MICGTNSTILSLWTLPIHLQVQAVRSWNDSLYHAMQYVVQVQQGYFMFWTGMMRRDEAAYGADFPASASHEGAPQDGLNQVKNGHGTIDGVPPSPLLARMIAAAVNAEDVRWH